MFCCSFVVAVVVVVVDVVVVVVVVDVVDVVDVAVAVPVVSSNSHQTCKTKPVLLVVTVALR